ncbi:MAG TPA: hypothetical protein VE913_15185 [Longimicrobium sp.]|nr:hypothetical protein [Longimicrobium sp.]
MIRITISTVAVAMLAACASANSGIVPLTSTTYPRTRAADVAIINPGDQPARPYVEIGRLTEYQADWLARERSDESIFRSLKAKAASIGGHALINVTDTWGTMTAIVIRYR